MKKNMSRFLSAVLAIVMVAAMLPATGVFAADAASSEVFTFKNTSGATRMMDTYTDYGSDNPNWRYFDHQDDFSGYFQVNTNGQFRTRVDSPTPGTAWAAFGLRFKNTELTAGRYMLSLSSAQIWPHGASSRSTSFYLAKKEEGKTSGADYINSANLVGTIASGNTGSLVTVDIGECTIADLDAEYVLVMQNKGAEFYLTNFTLTRTGDLPESAAFTFANTANGETPSANYTEYGTANPNWKYFDRSQELKDLATAGNALGTTYSGYFWNKAFKVLTSRDGSTATDVWTAFKIKAPLAEGKYELSFTIPEVWGGNEGGSAKMEMYFAPYDEAKTSGADYMTAANCIMPKQGISTATTAAPNKFDIPAGADEFILVIKLYTAQFNISGFAINKASASEVVYDFTQTGVNKAVTEYNSYEATGRNWHWLGASPELEAAIEYSIRFGRMVDGNIEIDPLNVDESADKRVHGSYHAFKLKAPEIAGVYALTIDCTGSGYLAGRGETDNTWIYVAEYNGADLTDYIDPNNLMNSGASWNATSITGDKYIYIDGTEEDLVFLTQISENNSNAKTEYNTITLTPVEVTASEVVASAESIKVGATANVRLELNGKAVIPAMVEYSSNDQTVAQVSSVGVVKGIKAGTATITLTAGDASATKQITVTPDELLSGSVSVAVYSYVDGVSGEEGISATPAITIGNVASVARRSAITLTATGIEGKEFKYWQTASGAFLSDEESYTFNANSHTAIVGVYESVADAEDGADVTIRFFNGFGYFIQKVVKEKGTLFADFASEVGDTDYRGFLFDSWKNADDSISDETPINKNDSVVAQYTETPEANYTVTGITNPGKYAYDEVVTAECMDAEFSYWTRNGEIVSYNPTYTFSVWGNTDVVAVCNGAATAVPTVILDNDGTTYMTEYSLPAGYTFVEAGIVFSNGGTPSINSCTSSASSKRLSGNHGQFTAIPASNETVARGYVVYVAPNGQLVATYSK